MTVEQKIAQKATEVKESRMARMSKIRLEIVETLAIGILDLLDEVTTSTGKEIPVERVNVHYDKLDKVWLQVVNKDGIYTESSEDSPQVAGKIHQLNGIAVNEIEDRYLQESLGKYCRILKLEDGFAIE